MTLFELAMLAVAGVVAGGVNAIAGGGTFFSFPALLAVGLPPVVANASNAVAVWPGHVAAVPAYRDRLRAVRHGLVTRVAVALVGGALGAWLLLASGDRLFAGLIPWLIGLATLLFAFGNRLGRLIPPRAPGAGLSLPALAVEFLFAVYGGYFGAGLGVLLMAALALLGHDDVQEANALKNLMSAAIKTVAVLVFAFAGVIAWPATLVMVAGSFAGGYFGARLAQRIPALWLKRVVVVFGAALTVHYFLK